MWATPLHACADRGSVVDITFVTPTVAARMSGWKVLEETETLSDHLYIRFRVSAQPAQQQRLARRGNSRFPRWATSRFDSSMATEAAIVEAWCDPPLEDVGVEGRASRLREMLTAVCDAAMPRQRRPVAKRSVYWWSEEIAALRRTSNAARRQYTHCRRRIHTAEEEEERYRALKNAKEALRLAITKAKDEGYGQLLEGLDRDPWGRPYKMVRNKLKHGPLIDSLEPELVDRVVQALFPPAPDFDPPVMVPPGRGGRPRAPSSASTCDG